MKNIEGKAQLINWWLRHNQQYDVKITFASLYTCIVVTITKDGNHVKSFIGDTFYKRLDEIIDYFKIKEDPKYKDLAKDLLEEEDKL